MKTIKSVHYRFWISACLCAGFALMIRLSALQVYQSSELFQPPEGGAHDRSVYVQAIQQVAGGTFWPDEAFEFLPLYPWLIGLITAVTGHPLMVAAITGIVCDVLTTFLIVLLAWRLGAHPLLSALAGLLYAAYPLAIIYSMMTMPNTLNAFGVTVFAVCAHAILQAGTPVAWKKRWRFVGLGLLAGIITLGFAGMLMMAAVVLIIMVMKTRSVMIPLLFIAGMALPIVPLSLHNSRAEGRFVLLTTHGGFNLYMGNHERATGYPLKVMNFRLTAKAMLEDAHRYAEQVTGTTMKRAESSLWWNNQAHKFWRDHPGRALLLTGKKVVLFWNHRDVDDLRLLEQLRILEPRFLQHVGIPFAVFGLMGLTGLLFARGVTVPRWIVLAGMAGLVMFFITARYRLTFVPLMAVLGSVGLTELWSTWKSEHRLRVLWMIPVVAIVFFPFAMRDQRPVDHYNVAIQLIAAQHDEEALDVIRRGLEIDSQFADLYFARGNVYFKREQFDLAETSYSRALSHNPNNPTAVFNLALSVARAGDYCRARDTLRYVQSIHMPIDKRAESLLRDLEAACGENR